MIVNFDGSFNLIPSKIVASPVAQKSKSRIFLPVQEMQETQFLSLSGEDPLEKEMATHSSILAWKVP